MPTATTVTDAMWQQYERDGYFVTDVVFEEADLALLRDAFNTIWQQRLKDAERGGDTHKINLTRYRPFISGLAACSDVCRRALFHPALLDIAKHIIGSDVDVTYDQAVIKAPTPKDAGVSNHFAWHQDAYYPLNGGNTQHWNRDKILTPHNGFMGWLAVTHATIDNGCLWAAPGFHTQGLLPHTRNETQREWVAQFDTSNKKPLELQPGQLLIFTPFTPHSSGPNITQNETRMAYQFGYATKGTCTLANVTPVLRGGEIAQG